MNIKKLSQSSVTLMFVIIVSKLIGMLRDVVLANYFGTSNVSDAYLIASTVPTFLFYFIGHSLSTAYIPMYNKVRTERGEEAAHKFTNNLLTIAILLSTVIVIILLLFPTVIVRVFAAGFDIETAQIAARLIRISVPSIYLMTMVNVCSGYLQANRSFLAPAFISFPRNLAIMVSVILAATIGIDMLGWGLLASYILEFLFLLPFVLRKGYIYKPYINLRDGEIRQTLYIVAPILLGMCVGQVNKMIDKSMASTVTEGGVSALTYASIINNSIQEILVTGIITILFASCAELVAHGNFDEVKKKLSGTVDTLIFLLIPASIGVAVLAEPIVKLVLCRGQFDMHSLEMTSTTLRYYSFGLLFLAIRDTLVKVFYAYKDTKVTTATSTIAITLNIVLNLVLGKLIGLKGFALATSISALFNCVALYILLRRKIGDFGMLSTLAVGIKSIIASTVMSISVWYIYINLQNIFADIAALLISVFAGIVVYLILSLLLVNTPLINEVKKIKSHTKQQGEK